MKSTIQLSRRRFMLLTMQVAAGYAVSGPLEGITAITRHPMSFYHTHTGERFNLEYSCEGCSPADLKRLNHFLRDFRTEEVFRIDPALLDTLYGIRQQSGCKGVIEIISGYRSPATNNHLRAKSGGVAKKSLHMKGQALDFRLTGLETRTLRDVAISLRQGGVGYYAKSDFVHIDTGRFRTW